MKSSERTKGVRGNAVQKVSWTNQMQSFIQHLAGKKKKQTFCHPGLKYMEIPSKTRQFPCKSVGTEVNLYSRYVQMLIKPQYANATDTNHFILDVLKE